MTRLKAGWPNHGFDTLQTHACPVDGHTTIAIAPADADDAPCAPSHCAGCASNCRSVVGRPCLAPQLHGPHEDVQRVMAALDADIRHGTDGCFRATDLVHALTLGDGEAELHLGVAREGGSSLLDAAFQTLRRLLPDTDIYVTHAA